MYTVILYVTCKARKLVLELSWRCGILGIGEHFLNPSFVGEGRRYQSRLFHCWRPSPHHEAQIQNLEADSPQGEYRNSNSFIRTEAETPCRKSRSEILKLVVYSRF